MPGLAFVHDNYDLTFDKVSKILSLASTGQLQGTEKTDGYRIFLGSRDGEARFAFNNGDKAKGGLDRQGVESREYRGGDKVRDVYLQAYDAFNKFVNELGPKEAQKVFGDGNIYFQAEIMGPGAPSVIQYDTNAISIHDSGHKYFDQGSGRVKTIPEEKKAKKTFIKEFGVDIDSASDVLSALLLRGEQQGGDMSVGRTALLKLQSIENDSDLRIALERMKKAGFGPGMTIENYLEEKLLANVERRFSHFSEQVQRELVDYMLGKRSEEGKRIVNLRSLYSGFPKDQVKAIRDFVAERNNILASAIWPIEDAIHDFTVEMLRGVESAYVLDNRAELARLRKEVREAIEIIRDYEGEGSESARSVLKRQLQKIKNFENISSTAEGFVFEFEGRMMKFTGNFTPVHKILSLFKYGSKGKGIPPLAQITSQGPAEEINEDEGDQLSPNDSGASGNANFMLDSEIDPSAYSKVMLFSGGFKPPHKAHLQAVVNASQAAGPSGRVFIIMTGPAKKKPRSIKGKAITFEQGAEVWNIFLNDAGLSNVDVVRATKSEKNPYASPMATAYNIAIDMIEQIDQEHKLGREINPAELTQIYLIGGAKDAGRYSDVISQYVPEHLKDVVEEIIHPYEEPTAKLDDGSTISATALRTYIEHDNFEGFMEYVPETSKNSADRIFSLLGGKRKMSEMIMSMVRELILEGEAENKAVQDAATAYQAQAQKVQKVQSNVAKAEDRNSKISDRAAKTRQRVQKISRQLSKAQARAARDEDKVAKSQAKIADVKDQLAPEEEEMRNLQIDFADAQKAKTEADAAEAEAAATGQEGGGTEGEEGVTQDQFDQFMKDQEEKEKQNSLEDAAEEEEQDELVAAAEEEESLDEVSSSGGGSVHMSPGSADNKKRKKSPTIFREEEEEAVSELSLPSLPSKSAAKRAARPVTKIMRGKREDDPDKDKDDKENKNESMTNVFVEQVLNKILNAQLPQ